MYGETDEPGYELIANVYTLDDLTLSYKAADDTFYLTFSAEGIQQLSFAMLRILIHIV